MFSKSIVVGVSVHPENGLEVAQVDYANKTVLKYGWRELMYDNARREIADMDIFKESLKDLFNDMGIPKGTSIVLNMPTVYFKVQDFPASLSEDQVEVAIEEDLMNHPIFQNTEGCISAVRMPNSTIQFNKIAYTVSQKSQLIEIAMNINEMGYEIAAIDTSVNSTLNSLLYNSRLTSSPDESWVMLLVENNCCRIIPMIGKNYSDTFEERISIGEVLGDAENYSTVLNAIEPVLKNLPSKMLYIVSKTNIISAEVLAQKLSYAGQIVHLDANAFAKYPFLDVAPTVDADIAKRISLDVIGAAINKDIADISTAHLNLYNKGLGDIFTDNQPLIAKFGSLELVLSLANMFVLAIIVAGIALAAMFAAKTYYQQEIDTKTEEHGKITKQIDSIKSYLAKHESISTEIFDEGDEIRIGLIHNKAIYSYYTIVGTEIPKKVWLTYLKLGNNVEIAGQADNLESIYSFYRNLKNYDEESRLSIKKLSLASNSPVTVLSDEESFETESLLTSVNADYYEFVITDGEVTGPPSAEEASAVPDKILKR